MSVTVDPQLVRDINAAVRRDIACGVLTSYDLAGRRVTRWRPCAMPATHLVAMRCEHCPRRGERPVCATHIHEGGHRCVCGTTLRTVASYPL